MEHTLTIGKFTLESLTSGLYVSSLDLYREYVQNAADSIDAAYRDKVLNVGSGKIEIKIDSALKSIKIQDNGVGVSDNDIGESLIDIGNSKKNGNLSRGFRGIGRLSGLGYCKKLIFTTSNYGEKIKTIITYDAELLQSLLLPGINDHKSVEEVMNSVMTVSQVPESENRHYFTVELEGVTENRLLNEKLVTDYLEQNLPVPFSSKFSWGTLIREKLSMSGVKVSEYSIELTFDQKQSNLYKPYSNNILSDRIRRIADPIQDINIVPFYLGNELAAVMWYAQTNFYGTILDSNIKGIRVRQGNILFGTSSLLRTCFKEERFSGWLAGELYITSNKILPNTRRDDYEKNAEYDRLIEEISKWAIEVSKMIRHTSYKRSLTQTQQDFLKDPNPKKIILSDLSTDDLNASEIEIDDMDDVDSVANNDLLSKMSLLMNMGNKVTKYNILNINSKMTAEQKKNMEHVFDILYKVYNKQEADQIIFNLVENY